jgi:hypothetical protein
VPRSTVPSGPTRTALDAVGRLVAGGSLEFAVGLGAGADVSTTIAADADAGSDAEAGSSVHVVAWTAGMDLARPKDGSITSTILGGEGFVTEFRGKGAVWLQTRDPTLFGPGTDGSDADTGGVSGSTTSSDPAAGAPRPCQEEARGSPGGDGGPTQSPPSVARPPAHSGPYRRELSPVRPNRWPWPRNPIQRFVR